MGVENLASELALEIKITLEEGPTPITVDVTQDFVRQLEALIEENMIIQLGSRRP